MKAPFTLFTFSSRHLLAWLTAVAALLVVGCENVPNGDLEESVDFDSSPTHANAAINNTLTLGQTPFHAILPKRDETHIVITKPGFKPADVYVHIEGSHLAPNPVNVKLRTELLPDKPGVDPKAELATCLENLKKYVAAGNIAPEDEAYAEAQIREFYK